MPPDATPADSSPAPSSPATFDLGTLSTDERTEWRLSGKLPDPKATLDAPPASPTPDPSSPADSTPAEPVEQVASTDASSQAASEPAAPKKSKADARKAELGEEINSLLARRNQIREEIAAEERQRQSQPKPDAKPGSSPAATPEFPGYDVWQQTHEDGSYDEYLLDKFEHVQTQKQAVAQQKTAAEQFTRSATERAEAFAGRYRDALALDDTLPSKISPRLFDADTVDTCVQSGKPIAAINVIAQEIMESPAPVKLLVHLSEHPDELASLQQLSAAGLIRRMTELRLQLDTPAIPPPKTISSAPAVTTTLGSRPAVPGDPLQAAIKSGDFRQYRELMNARDLASAK